MNANTGRLKPEASAARRLLLALMVVTSVLSMSPVAHAAFPGVNGRIVFYTNRDDNFEIYSVEVDGTDLLNLTNDVASDVTPAWSPDGTKIAFMRNYKLHVMDADGTDVTLIETVHDGFYPAWSPDGSSIAYLGLYDEDIHVVDVSGSGTDTNITNSPAWERPPSWSPDGSRIAFGRYDPTARVPDDDIWIMDPDGTRQRQITRTPGFDGLPDWSPDGHSIAFCGSGPYGYDIFTMNPNGSSRVNLTSSSDRGECAPRWSPDGQHLLYHDYREDGSDIDIFVMNADGTGATTIATDPAEDVLASWQPRVPSPTNDDIAAATPIDVLPFTDGPLDTRGATTDTDPPDPDCIGNGPTVWYRFEPAEDMVVRADTFGSDYDTTLSAYTGSPGALTQIACNDDDNGSLQSQVVFEVQAHMTYHLMVGAYSSGSGGSLMVSVSRRVPPGAIAFERNLEGNLEIFVLGEARFGNVTNSPYIDANPALSPDGKNIVFVSDRAGNLDIWMMAVDGSNLRQLTATPAEDYNPSWSPNGRRVAFARREPAGSLDVYVMNVTGARVTNLTRDPLSIDAQPSFTPEGDEILFMKNFDIWIMKADGGEQRPLVRAPGFDEWPHLARGQVLFHSTRSGSYDVWSVPLNGDAEPTRLSLDDWGSEVWPVWSPDGSMIVYQDDGMLVTANADGTNVVPLVAGDFPSWSVDTP